jgi:hypothetical protein
VPSRLPAGRAIQVMLCPQGAATPHDYPAGYRLAFIRQHYLQYFGHFLNERG